METNVGQRCTEVRTKQQSKYEGNIHFYNVSEYTFYNEQYVKIMLRFVTG